MKTWDIYYRGSLSSCNYACDYCPFAKTANTRAELRQDQRQLERFVSWVEGREERLGILITPWGEALGQRAYRSAMIQLSHFPHVYRIAIQTNLHAPLADLGQSHRDRLALWATFHPTQTSLKRFLSRCQQLDALGISYSVGVVGLREHFEAIEQLRNLLLPEVYLWINAYKRQPDYYGPGEVARLGAVDPYFEWNLRRYPSAGKPCRAGQQSFAVDGQGDARRCHFVGEVIGNIYASDFEECLHPRDCPAALCGCHIGYIHRPELALQELYGDGLLERIPRGWPTVDARFSVSPWE